MVTVGRTAPLRRTGSLLGLLALEVAAVLGLHWLGRFDGLQVRWDKPVPWLLDSPIQDVLGSLLRMVALVMAYWLLASTLLYLLASLTRLPGAVRAVGWATLPLVRRVADHAVAVTLATSMVGGTTLGVAGPALAADSRGFGPPAPKPVAAAGATGSGTQDGPTTTEPEPTRTSEPVYEPDPADQVPTTTTAPPAAPPPPTTEPEPTRASEPVYTPDPADQTPRPLQEDQPATTTTAGSTTTTEAATATTAGATATTAGPANRSGAATSRTEATTTAAPTAKAPATTAAAPTTAASAARQGVAAPTTASTSGPERQPSAAGTPATTHAYVPNAASDFPESGVANPGSTTTTNPGGGSSNPGGGASNPGGTSNPGGGDQGTGRDEEQAYRVVRGDNLWKIARDHLSRERSGGSGQPTNHEVAAYWLRVIEANRDGLRSGDPDLIYPGERINLPPLD